MPSFSSSSSVKGRSSRPVHSLVLDTAPLLTTPYGQIKSFNATNYYTVPLAKEEVKDETARAALQIWGSELRVRQPLAKSIEEVTAFSKKTGDYAVLSPADLHVLALTYELECELNHGDWRLLKEPGSKERRGPQPGHRPQTYSTVSPVNVHNDLYDDDDTRSVLTDFTTATITPSESASTIFHNTFNVLKPPSSSGSSTPRSSAISPKFAAFENDSAVARSESSTTSTARATIDPPSSAQSITTRSLVSARSGANKDWSIQSDDDDDDDEINGVPTPTRRLSHGKFSPLSFEQSLRNLGLTSADIAGDEVEEDGQGNWITPSNIKKHKIRDCTTTNSFISSTTSGLEPTRPTRRRSDVSERPAGAIMKSACMTADFAMQNVALQMGLNLVRMDGGAVKSVKTWVLRCHGCFQYSPLKPTMLIMRITKNVELKFCPSCGGQTLLRASTSTNSNGETQIHLKKNMQWTNRGTKFSLPKPAGMTATPSHSTPPPILRADQKEFVRAHNAKKKREKDLMDPDNIPTFLDGSGKIEGFGFGGRSAGRIGGGRGRGTNAVRRR